MSRKNKPWKWFMPLLCLLLLIVLEIVVITIVHPIRKENTAEKQEVRISEPMASSETEDAIEADTSADKGITSKIEESADDGITEYVEQEPEVILPEEVNTENRGKLIAIDPGHQGKGNSEQEPIGPGASQTKDKVASGTTGRTTGVPEYQLNLDVSLKLHDELEARGYEVYMIRESNDVNISNAERAQAAANVGADILVRIHANGSDNTSVAGALTMAPSFENSFVDSETVKKCQELSQAVITAFCESTGAKNQGVYQTDEMSGLNWCTIPATIVEMGYMTNPEEDVLMQTEEYQEKIVQGIANGIDQYFSSEE